MKIIEVSGDRLQKNLGRAKALQQELLSSMSAALNPVRVDERNISVYLQQVIPLSEVRGMLEKFITLVGDIRAMNTALKKLNVESGADELLRAKSMLNKTKTELAGVLIESKSHVYPDLPSIRVQFQQAIGRDTTGMGVQSAYATKVEGGNSPFEQELEGLVNSYKKELIKIEDDLAQANSKKVQVQISDYLAGELGLL
jgi:hypothetical protein